ncbi:MAG TPA: response regulator transcription factor [Vicinamibacterales bacterium]|nr:response regulator transcription factor [Vicinamibacterales bacterium]
MLIKEVYGVSVDTGFEVVGEAGSGEETFRVVQSVKPDLVLLDPALPHMSGMEVLRELNAYGGRVRSILLAETIHRAQLLTALSLGVRGFVLKESATEKLLEAIVCVMADQCWVERTLETDLLEWLCALMRATPDAPGTPATALTHRQQEVLLMVVAGHANKEIALKFALSEQTVKHHLTRIFEKLGASNRLELAFMAKERGLILRSRQG